MYIRREVYFSAWDDQLGEERLFSTTELVPEEEYLKESGFSDYSDYDDYDDCTQRMYAAGSWFKKAGKAIKGVFKKPSKLDKAKDFLTDHKWGIGATAAAVPTVAGSAYYLNKKRKQKLAEAAAAQEIADDALEEAQYAQQMYAEAVEAEEEAPKRSRYERAKDFVKDKYGKTKDFVKSNPYKTGAGALGLAGTGTALARGHKKLAAGAALLTAGGIAGGHYLDKRRRKKLEEAIAAQEIADDALEEANFSYVDTARDLGTKAWEVLKANPRTSIGTAVAVPTVAGSAYLLNKRRKRKKLEREMAEQQALLDAAENNDYAE